MPDTGFLLGPESKSPSAAEIWNRHSVEITVIYAGVFVLLALMEFTIWARIGFAALGGFVFGSVWICGYRVDEENLRVHKLGRVVADAELAGGRK